MKCIYCNSEEELTSSDIITYAITGAKLTKSFVCKTHNAYTNDSYEKKFVSDLDFFRNQLGLLTRDGKQIQFTADLNVDGVDMYGVRLSNRRALYSPKGVVVGRDIDGKKVLMAPAEKLKHIKKELVNPVDIRNVTMHKTISSDSFIGYYAIHSIAKMAYEWHCFRNNVEGYDEKYEEIVDYILGKNDSNVVDIITDGYYYYIIDQLSEVGTNSFFEYDDKNGYRYVVFGLWNTIAYRIKICKSPKDAVIIRQSVAMSFDVFLYHIDGSKQKTAFGVFPYNGEINHYEVAVTAPSKITLEKWKIFEKRIGKIIKTMILSIRILKQKVNLISEDLKKYDEGKIGFEELIGFEENDIITVLEVINRIHENIDKYDESKSFNENLASILDIKGDSITRTSEQKTKYVKSLLEMEKEGVLSSYIMNGIDAFNKVYQIEMMHK